MADYFDSSLPIRTVTTEHLQSNVTKINGTATDVNIGNASAGTQRVVLASDQPSIPVTQGYKVAILDYNTVAAVAAAASSTHTFTPAATFRLTDVYATMAGQGKVEIQTGPTGTETTKIVLFSSKANPSAMHWHLDSPLQILTTDSVKVIRTNGDNQATDVYSTIQGFTE